MVEKKFAVWTFLSPVALNIREVSEHLASLDKKIK
jgi:hypothetical protein